MSLSEINSVAEDLGQYILESGIMENPAGVAALYPNTSVPTNGLPESFLEITGNGPMTTMVSQFGISDYHILLILNVKLKSTGEVNTQREDFLLSLIDGSLKGVITVGKYHYSIDKRQMVYSGRDLISGYSSKIININVKIY